MDMPQAPVSWRSDFDSQKIQQEKLWQKTLDLSFLCEGMGHNQKALSAITQVRLSFSGLTPGEFISFPGEKSNISLLSTNKELFPQLFTETEKPNCKCEGGRKSFLYCQNEMALGFLFLVDSVAE